MQTIERRIGLSRSLLKQIVDILVKYVRPKRIIVYGSRARGDYNKTSDIDIAVECGEGSRLVRNVIDDEVRTLLKLDIIDLDAVESPLRNEIEQEGIVVYEKIRTG